MANTATAFDGGDINVIISNVLDDNWLDSGEVSQDSGEEEGGGSLDSGENASFWKVQRCLVEEFIEVGNSDESKLQQDVIGALKIARSSEFCTCGGGPCTACLKHEVAHLLRVSGYDAALCKSKWRTTKHIPKGKHEYLDLILANGSRLIIELDFRAEFEIARSSQDYHNLVNLLPEVYIGKPDHLEAILSIICEAGKKSLTERKMHMGPWRTRRYMQAKWLGPYTRMVDPTDSPKFTFSAMIPAIGFLGSLESHLPAIIPATVRVA